MVLKVALVVVGGGMGSLLRYLASLLSVRLFGAGFPVGTLVVNLAGCFAIGLVFGLAEGQITIRPHTRLLLMTGFLGGLTTFSSYALETVTHVQEGAVVLPLASFAANNLGGITLVLVGMWLGRAV